MPRPASLSLDLLKTFLLLLRHEGDAARTARELGINQPSMSKRLRYLQHAGPLLPRPWVEREGKTWRATEEGERVLPAVREIVARHEQLTRFIHQPLRVQVHFACGQQDMQGRVRKAVRHFQRKHPLAALRLTTLRGSARIEGVANGSLDLATVSHEPSEIHRLARRELYIEELWQERLVLACASGSEWAETLAKLPKTRVAAESLVSFPLIVPEQDSGTRLWLDRVLRQEGVLDQLPIVLETGGWATIRAYVEDEFGVGILPESTISDSQSLVSRRLDPAVFAPRVTRLIARWLDSSAETLDLSPAGTAFREALLKTGTPPRRRR